MPYKFILQAGCMLLLSGQCFFTARCQQTDTTQSNTTISAFNHMERAGVFLPTSLSDFGITGTPWYSKTWVPGQVNFSDGHSLPVPGEVLYVNYDKQQNKLFYKKGDSIIAFDGSRVTAFQLDDSLGIHSFTKLAAVNPSVFLEIISATANGFSVYRRMQSHFRPPDYENVGYTSNGSRSGRYLDDIYYFLFYPDGKNNVHFSLSGSAARKKLSRINGTAKQFLMDHPGAIDKSLLFSLCEALNANGRNP